MKQMRELRTLQYLIIDMDGVLYRGKEPVPGAPEFLAFLRRQEIDFILATNNSTRTPDQYVARLAEMGVAAHAHEILTSAQATAGYLTTVAPPGARVFMIGQDGLRAALQEAGFVLVEADAEYVVVGMDYRVCFERLSEAALMIRAGAPFIGTNSDRTFPSERGIIPGAGCLLTFLETATDVAPHVIGKPQTAMVHQAIARLGAEPGQTAMLGDRLETDILAGQRAGLATILVLSGVTNPAMLAESAIQPDLVFQDVDHLHRIWAESPNG